MDTNNSAVFDNGHSSPECTRSKRECEASTDVDTKYEKEKSSQDVAKKNDERVKLKYQGQYAFNSRF